MHPISSPALGRLSRLPLTLFFLVLLGGLAGLAAAHAEELRRAGLLLGLALVAPAPIVVRIAQRRWDPLEPVALLSVMLTVLFVVRPGAHVVYGEYFFTSRDLRPGFDGALGIALLGTASTWIGYASGAGRVAAARLPAFPDRWTNDQALRWGVGLTGLGVCLFGVFVLQSGGLGFLLTYVQGRTSTDSQQLQGSSAYLYLGLTLAIPAALLLLEGNARRPSRRAALGAVVAMSTVVGTTLLRGDRTYLLVLALAVVAASYLRSGRRPRGRSIVAALLVGILCVNLLLITRTQAPGEKTRDASLVQSVIHPGRQFKQFVLGPDPAMFSVLALLYEVVPSKVPEQPGLTLRSAIAAPVPGLLWPSKPIDGANYVYRYLYPQQARLTRAGNAPSVFGSFYQDLGWAGLVVYPLLLGVATRALWEWLRLRVASAPVRLVYATSVPLLFNLIRGGVPDTLGRALYLVGPLLAFAWLTARRSATLR